jgi:hypothetical protein
MGRLPEIFFSYAWDDEHQQSGSREKIVDELYQSLLKDGCRVVRDKDSLEYKGFISDFMGRLGRGKCIVVAVSRKYLKSPYCMFELYEIARNSNFDRQEFSKRVFPIMLEWVDFADPVLIDEYFTFWETEYKKWDDLVKKRSAELSVEQMQRFDKIKMIYQNFGKLTDWIVDMNTLSPGILLVDDFSGIKKAILEKGSFGFSGRVIDGTRLFRMSLFWTVVAVGAASLVYWLGGPWNGRNPPIVHQAVDSATGKKQTAADGQHTRPVKPDSPTHSRGPLHSRSLDTKTKDTVATTPPNMCKGVCRTKGIVGVEVSFSDPRTQKTYSQVSAGNDLEFSVPCYLLNQVVTISFKKHDTIEERNFRLQEFEIPELFTPR